jgi:hypothetical protein
MKILTGKCTFNLQCICSLFSKKKLDFKIFRSLEKYSYVYLHILCAHTQFHENPIFLVGYAKKTKKASQVCLI